MLNVFEQMMAQAAAAQAAEEELEFDVPALTTFPEFANKMVSEGKQWVLTNLRRTCESTFLGQNLVSKVQLYGIQADELLFLQGLGDIEDGAFWVPFCTCSLVDSRCAKSKEHSRWKLNFGGGDVAGIVSTPQKGAARDLKLLGSFNDPVTHIFDASAWNSFKAVGRVTNPSKGPQRGVVNITVHQLYYAASPKMLVTPLPLDSGTGSSLSHFCDMLGCTGERDASHLEVVQAHVDNVVRQRCPGAQLTVGSLFGERMIVARRLCRHSGGETSRCCRKVTVTDIGDIDELRNTVEAAVHESKKQKVG